jgi:hypothetical protein
MDCLKRDFGIAPAVLAVDSAPRSRARPCARAGRATFRAYWAGTSAGVWFV